MKRLVAAMRWDVQLQVRQGFYYAAALVAAILIIIVSQLPGADFGLLLPAILLENLVVNTFYFIAGLVLLEKGEGSLEFLVVTPLRATEYLTAKLGTLSLLSVVESLVIVIATVLLHRIGFNPLPLLIGLLITAVFYALVGFIFVARFDSINEFLFPSVLPSMLFTIPFLPYFDLVQSPLFYLHPLLGPLLLMRAAFAPIPAWQLVYGVIYPGIWIAVLYPLARRAFQRFIIRREGVK